MVIPYRRFGTTDQAHLQGSRIDLIKVVYLTRVHFYFLLRFVYFCESSEPIVLNLSYKF